MTEPLYHTDAYLQEFDSNVTAVFADDRAVVLDRTAFYPGGGGQPCDFGSLNVGGVVYGVDKVKKQGDDILHFFSGTSPLPSIGFVSHGTLDWVRRHKLMRTHTALHVLCGTIFRDYGASVTGGNMEPLKGHLDFEFETMRSELVRDIEIAINKEVQLQREIRVNILPREEAFQIPDLIRTKINLLPPGIQEVRVVNIEGIDQQADGGTHVANTSEVGRVRITKSENKGRINKRLEIVVE